MTVLDGQVVEAAGLSVLGDDDPEHNVPFSVDRIKDRPESEEEHGGNGWSTVAGNKQPTCCSFTSPSPRG